MNKELVRELGNRVKRKELTWEEASKEFLTKLGYPISRDALRKRYEGLNINGQAIEPQRVSEYENHYGDGSVDLQRRVFFNKDEDKTPNTILEKFGYNPSCWELVEWRFGEWEMPVGTDCENRLCTTVKAKIKPRTETELTTVDLIDDIKEIINSEIKPLTFKKEKISPH